MIWNRDIETMSRAALAELQAERLRSTVDRVYRNVPFYRDRFDRAGVAPGDVREVEDLSRLPFTRKTDFRDQYPFGLFAVPREDVVRVHASSGTTGKPTIVGYTRADLETWAEVCARSLAAAGAVPGDVFQNAYGYGLFTGGLGMHYGGERMGLTVIPVSAGNTERQILLLQDLRPRIFACTPSYALALAEALAERGIDATGLGLATLILGAEPWTEEMRGRIEAAFAAHAVNIYGLSEVIGPGVSCECVEVKHGSHVFEDHFLPEIVDPETGEPKAPGEIGELVLTSLTKEALPIVRYRTGDLCSLDLEPCACGRTLARMSRIVGRADDMLIIRGVNLFPTQVEAVLVEFADLSPHYRLLVRREGELDAIAIEVEVTAELHGRAAESGLEPLRRDIGRRLAGVTMLTNVDIRFVAPGTLPRSEGGKLRRVVDERKPS